jgi:signal transduction histidine kinase
MKENRQVGLSLEILFTILFITAVAMFLISLIAFNVMEQFALKGKTEGLKSVIQTFENVYYKSGDTSDGIKFLESTLEKGSWGIIADDRKRAVFTTLSNHSKINVTDPLILEVMRTGETILELKGFNVPPIKFHEALKIVSPIQSKNRKGVILIYHPLSSLRDNILSGQQQVSIWIILFLLIIALLGFYVLSRRIIRPVRELIFATEQIAEGEFPQNIDIGNVRELNQLSSALHAMHLQIEQSKGMLKENIDALEQSNKVIKSTQKELIASEKFASLGKLSAGVAHEIGNPLSAIVGYVDVLNKTTELSGDDKKRFLNNIKNEVLRIDRIIKTLLDYARAKEFEIKQVNLNDIIRDAVNILETQGMFNNIELKMNLDEKLRTIDADAHQISQVIINLLLNAVDALDEKGEIVISSMIDSQDKVEITVQDNGVGITEENIDKIFDPFFTTKEPGKGTGLGLSVSVRIVQYFGGDISVQSNKGAGSVFRIKFA